ncbi:FAD-binding protein [Hyphococcus lacteus]|uniref:FAD-binding protein n=1 Tax=Hyphococcus lacteus TaxID=3143536 RepID=A0ABV3Z978_9PROT
MREVWKPQNVSELQSAIKDALSSQITLELRGSGSKRRLGRKVHSNVLVDLSRISGITLYEPEEMIITVRPGTPLAEIEAALAQHNQRLAFDPPSYVALWGASSDHGTIGGAMMTGRAGSRRLTAGGPRDHCLGVKAVNGFGEICAAGGRVVKNVTGFDISKLVTGSFGTLCAVSELTLKTHPTPNDTVTLALLGLDDVTAVDTMRQAMSSSCQVSAAAYLPEQITNHFANNTLPPHISATLLRLDGFHPTTRARAETLSNQLKSIDGHQLIPCTESRPLWMEISNAQCFSQNIEHALWHISVPPKNGPEIIDHLRSMFKFDYYFDWAGGGIWVEIKNQSHDYSTEIRQTIRDLVGGDGHATLMRTPHDLIDVAAPFQPLAPEIEAITRRIKSQFDPMGIFNPGRMYKGI